MPAFPAYANQIIAKHGFFFIAEVSNNHLGDLHRYKQIVQSAKDSGAHAVKIQTYTANSLCLEISKFNHPITSGPWAGQTYWDLYKSMEVPLSWSLEVRDFAESIGIPLFSSPFSPSDVQYLVANGFEMLKVASGEFACPELIDSIIKSGIHFMASTGFSGPDDLIWMHERLSESNARDLLWCLFNCVSNYPTDLSELDLSKFSLLKSYSPMIGLSDHSLDSNSCLISYVAGARVFEKHLTLDRADGGPDGFFSLEPAELKQHIDLLSLAAANATFNSASIACSPGSGLGKASLKFSRSIYAKEDIKRGDVFTVRNIGSYRPSHDEPAVYLDQMLGKSSEVDIAAGQPVFLRYV